MAPRPTSSLKSSCRVCPRHSVNQWCPWCGPQRVWTLRWGHSPALCGGQGHRWDSVAHVHSRVWSGSCGQSRRSVFMLTHNDAFHRAPRIITKGFPLLNGNYKRQIDSKLLTSWVKQLLLPSCHSCGWWCRQESAPLSTSNPLKTLTLITKR